MELTRSTMEAMGHDHYHYHYTIVERLHSNTTTILLPWPNYTTALLRHVDGTTILGGTGLRWCGDLAVHGRRRVVRL